MPKKLNLIGQKFTRWTVVEETEKRASSGQVIWKCICDCGKEGFVKSDSLKSGGSKSCGCLQVDTNINRLTSHGKSDLPEYAIWQALKRNNRLKMCDRWIQSFECFYDDLGGRPSENYYIFRLNKKDGYTPDNCIWKQKIDLTGQRFGRLLVISRYDSNKWICKCDCGNEKITLYNNLKRGLTQSCGCLQIERIKEASITHGDTIEGKVTSEYISWQRMKNRCYKETVKGYKDYGGRGIKVCERWLGEKGFENFLSDMGRKPTSLHTLDRYPDMNGNYEPSNCRWGTKKEQAIGRRRTKWIEYNGERMIQKEWAEKLKVCQHTIARFLKMGKTIGDIMEKYKHRQTVS